MVCAWGDITADDLAFWDKQSPYGRTWGSMNIIIQPTADTSQAIAKAAFLEGYRMALISCGSAPVKSHILKNYDDMSITVLPSHPSC